MFKRSFAVALLAGACLPFVSQAETFNTCTKFIDAVPAVIDTQGVYCLRRDVATGQSSGYAIEVKKNNVTIDCNGYKVGGLGGGEGTQAVGIAAHDRLNVVVRNCSVRGFLYGITLNGSGHVAEDNSADGNRGVGIQVTGDGGLIRNNRISNTGAGTVMSGAHGIYASGNTDVVGNTIDGVLANTGVNTHGGVWGIFVWGTDAGTGTVLTGGVRISGNVVRNLVASGSGGSYGVHMYGGMATVFRENRVTLKESVNSQTVGYFCDQPGAPIAALNNHSWGYAVGIIGCEDAGGNVVE